MLHYGLVPRRNRDFDLFDDFFDRDIFASGTNALMKTDIKEKKDKYVIEMDLPGFEKENVKVDLADGYLKVSAESTQSHDEGDEHSRFMRRERFYGQCSRSFYVGDDVKREDVHAAFKNGVLTLSVPKVTEQEKLPESTQIAIE
ncbi:Hsp20/alpha crystallin family protein [bacterium]|nr:Hsp20/alpha crystallin family protein [bacterium]